MNELSAKPRGVRVTFGRYAKKRSPQAGAGRSDGKGSCVEAYQDGPRRLSRGRMGCDDVVNVSFFFNSSRANGTNASQTSS